MPKKATKKRGKGIFGSIAKGGLKLLAPILVDALGGLVKSKVSGMGRKKRVAKKKKSTKRKSGKGIRAK